MRSSLFTGTQTHMNYDSLIHRVRIFQSQSQLFVCTFRSPCVSRLRLIAIATLSCKSLCFVYLRCDWEGVPPYKTSFCALHIYTLDLWLYALGFIVFANSLFIKFRDLSIAVYRPIGSGFSSQSQFPVSYILRCSCDLRLRLGRGPTSSDFVFCAP